MTMQKWIFTFLAFFLFADVVGATAQTLRPIDALRNPLNRIIVVLNDPVYTAPDSKDAQRDAIWEIAKPMFDFGEISRRAIGKPWLGFTGSEKDRFTSAFSEFLGNTYVDKLQGEYSNEVIEYQKELIKGSKALVRTKLRREGTEIPIDYRMKNIDGNWKVYDIIVENGVSLVKNYRVQFTSILQNQSPDQLIQRLEEKLSEQANNLSEAN